MKHFSKDLSLGGKAVIDGFEWTITSFHSAPYWHCTLTRSERELSDYTERELLEAVLDHLSFPKPPC